MNGAEEPTTSQGGGSPGTGSCPGGGGSGGEEEPSVVSVPTDTTQLRPHQVFPSWIIFGTFTLLIGLALTVTMSLLLHTQAKKSCSGLTAIGAVFLIIGLVLFFGGFLIIRFWALRHKQVRPSSSRVGRYVFMGFMVLFYGICIFIVVVGSAFYAMYRSQPQLDLNHKIAGLSGPVFVQRDPNGIPHVSATTLQDAIIAQGFVVAQDRMFQLELSRLAARGKMAQFFGSAALDIDKATRAMGFEPAASLFCDRLTPGETETLDNYVTGINAYLESDGALPPEFMFMGSTYFSFHHPEPFARIDLCSVGRLLQFQISTNTGLEAERWKLFAEGGLTFDEIQELYSPSTHENRSSIVPAHLLGLTEADAQAARTRDQQSFAIEKRFYDEVMDRFREDKTLTGGATVSHRHEFAAQEERGTSTTAKKKKTPGDSAGPSFTNWFSGFHYNLFNTGGIGSNGWAVRLAGNNNTFGAGDPHLDSGVPANWHPIVMNVNGSKYTGSSIPGLPGLLYGKTPYIHWGFTISFGDMADYYIMEPDPSNPETHYMYHGVSIPYTERREVIKVVGGDDYVMVVQESVLGPVVGVQLEMTTHHKIVFNATGILREGSFAPLWEFWQQENVTAAVEKLQPLTGPALSGTIGDNQGGLAYVCTGLHAIRAPGHTGRFPVLGNGSFDFLGFVPANELPKIIDNDYTKNGRVTSANQQIAADGYKYALGYDFWAPYRFDRIVSTLDDSLTQSDPSLLTFDHHQQLQVDTRSNIWAETYRPLLVSFGETWTNKLDANGLQLWQTMLQWNNHSSFGATEPTYFTYWLYHFTLLPTKVLATLEYSTWKASTEWPAWAISTPGPYTQSLCAAKSTSGSGTCLDYAAEQWNSVATLPPRRWGYEFNQLHLKHTVFGDTFLNCLFDNVVNKAGDSSSVNHASESSRTTNFGSGYVTHVASQRLVYGFGHEKTYYSLPGGASGNAFSKYFSNLAGIYGADQYIELDVSDTAVVNEDEAQVFEPLS